MDSRWHFDSTAVVVLRLYLDHLFEYGTLQYTIRSDQCIETHMKANAHCQLHQELNPDTVWNDHYWYGTSTANQRIESWWRHMSKGQTIVWKVCISPLFTTALLQLKLTADKRYFDGLASAGLWSGNTADTIALLSVYMPRDIWIRRPVECTYHPTAG